MLQPRDGAWWDSLRIGLGPPPLRTEHGWLLIYHGVKETVAGGIYRVGLALIDLDEPTRCAAPPAAVGPRPLAPYEREGDVPNTVFPCGLVHDEASGEIRLYYGAPTRRSASRRRRSTSCSRRRRRRSCLGKMDAETRGAARKNAGAPITAGVGCTTERADTDYGKRSSW